MEVNEAILLSITSNYAFSHCSYKTDALLKIRFDYKNS